MPEQQCRNLEDTGTGYGEIEEVFGGGYDPRGLLY
jgi:hypothetical protein